MKVCERSDGGEQRGDGGFDVDQLWMWCFVCAAVTPRSGRKMRKGPFFFGSLRLAGASPEARAKQGACIRRLYGSERRRGVTQRQKRRAEKMTESSM